MTPSAVTAAVCTITPASVPILSITGGNERGRWGMRWGPREEAISATERRQLPVSSAERESEVERRESISCRACKGRASE